MNLTAEIALAHRLADAAREAIRPHFRTPVAAERKADDRRLVFGFHGNRFGGKGQLAIEAESVLRLRR